MTLAQETLIIETKKLFQTEKETNAQIIRNLIVLYKDKVHLELGYSFEEFCVVRMGICRTTAQRKFEAVKLSLAVPELPKKLESGEMSLAKVMQVTSFLKNEKKFAQKTFTNTEVRKIVEEIKVQPNEWEVKRVLSKKSEMVHPPVLDKVRFVSGGRKVQEMEVDDEFLDLLKEVQQLRSHKGFQPRLETLKTVLRFYLEKNHPAKKQLRSPRGLATEKLEENQQLKIFSKEASSQVPPKSGRGYISQGLKQQVWRENSSSCSFKNPLTGQRCGSTFRLQIEHKIPVAMGGQTTESNLTLYCQAHNLFAADRLGLPSHRQFKQQALFD